MGIPVTIAKLTDGIDATTVALTDAASPSVSSKFLNAETTTRTLNFQITDSAATGIEKTVALIYNNAIQQTTTTVSLAGSFEISTTLLGTPMALAVKSGSAEDAAYSPPVIVTLYQDTSSELISVLV